MICLRSGYCCIHLDVMIIDDPEKGIVEGNVKHKPSGERCQHLSGSKIGEFSCSVHNREWYKDTPCFDFSQIEQNNTECRLGKFFISESENKKC